MKVRQSVLVISLLMSTLALAATKSRPLLSDGSFLARVEGSLVASEPNEMLEANQDRWFFELADKVTDGRVSLKAGTVLELLPSSALERMIVDSAATGQPGYLLWARVTKYRGRNYLFADRSIPITLRRTETEKQQPPGEPQKNKSPEKPEPVKTGPAVTDPNDVLKLPPRMTDILNRSSSIRPRQPLTPDTANASKDSAPKGTLKYASDRLLPNRMGSMTGCSKKVGAIQQCLSFKFESYGRAVEPETLILLPCEALELAQKEKSLSIQPPRFRAAGIVTRYRGNQYLLLQRVTRVYSYQNLGR